MRQFGGLIRQWVPCLYESSVPLMESIGRHVMVDDTENLKIFLYGLPNIKLSYTVELQWLEH